MTPIETYVFFDLETTGLINETIPGITELGMIAVKRTHFLNTKVDEELRVQYKFCMCFNPEKDMSQRAVELSGLTNELLEMEAKLNTNAFSAISSFINCLQKPVCLIAHNGFAFHFPVLKNFFPKMAEPLSPDIMCTDSLFAFYDLLEAEIQGEVDPEVFDESKKEKSYNKLMRPRFFWPNEFPSNSYQLKDIYRRDTIGQHLQGNRAENHCNMMLKIAQGRPEMFCKWVAVNHCLLNEI